MTGSSPTTQASWPEGSAVTCPATASNVLPSASWIRSVPATWYWKCGASHKSVPTIGLTCSDHRQPGWRTSRPMSLPPMRSSSSRPWGNVRTSSACANSLCSAGVMILLLVSGCLVAWLPGWPCSRAGNELLVPCLDAGLADDQAVFEVEDGDAQDPCAAGVA